MISKAKAKFIRSLGQKKNRNDLASFVAEGPKVVGDLMTYWRPTMVVATKQWLLSHRQSTAQDQTEWIEVSDEELRRVSFLQHPQQVLAVFSQPSQSDSPFTLPDENAFLNNLYLALDGIQDPGNLGTIIRLADWFGVDTIFCSPKTADVWNPKVIQATMGSIARVRVVYQQLTDVIRLLPVGTPVYGTLLDGQNLYEQSLKPHGLLVMGNEAQGLSQEIRCLVTHHLRIPNYPPQRPTAESLNVAIATAVVLAELRRIS